MACMINRKIKMCNQNFAPPSYDLFHYQFTQNFACLSRQIGEIMNSPNVFYQAHAPSCCCSCPCRCYSNRISKMCYYHTYMEQPCAATPYYGAPFAMHNPVNAFNPGYTKCCYSACQCLLDRSSYGYEKNNRRSKMHHQRTEHGARVDPPCYSSSSTGSYSTSSASSCSTSSSSSYSTRKSSRYSSESDISSSGLEDVEEDNEEVYDSDDYDEDASDYVDEEEATKETAAKEVNASEYVDEEEATSAMRAAKEELKKPESDASNESPDEESSDSEPTSDESSDSEEFIYRKEPTSDESSDSEEFIDRKEPSSNESSESEEFIDREESCSGSNIMLLELHKKVGRPDKALNYEYYQRFMKLMYGTKDSTIINLEANMTDKFNEACDQLLPAFWPTST